jgi:hypothetical protein
VQPSSVADSAVQPDDARMRNRQAVSERRTCLRFALYQRGEQAFPVDAGMPPHDLAGQLLERFIFGTCFEVREHP